MTMRWLVTGAGGQLGHDLTDVLTTRGADVVALARAELDITDPRAVATAIDVHAPAVVVNAAAYTAVDAAETDESLAYAVNAEGPAALAAVTKASGALLVHVSTDYVFAGDADRPYAEDAPVAPRSAYGRTKAAGEARVLGAHPDAYVVRTAWVYGARGGNFVKTMARLERTQPTVRVVADQRGAPTWSADLARGLVALAERRPAPGIYHCTNSAETTWFTFARAIFEELGADPARVQPTTTDAFPRPAPRPAYSVLSDARWVAAGLPRLPHWRAALGEAFAIAGAELRSF